MSLLNAARCILLYHFYRMSKDRQYQRELQRQLRTLTGPELDIYVDYVENANDRLCCRLARF